MVKIEGQSAGEHQGLELGQGRGIGFMPGRSFHLLGEDERIKPIAWQSDEVRQVADRRKRAAVENLDRYAALEGAQVEFRGLRR